METLQKCHLNYIPRGDTPFARDVKMLYSDYFRTLSPFATPGYWLRLACYFSFYLASVFCWVFRPSLVSAILFGLSRLGVALNVMHDANHGSVSAKPWVNQLLGYTMNMLGSTRGLWFQGHNVQHHTFSGQYRCDPDESNIEPFAIVNPNSPLPLRWYHRMQLLIVLCLSPLMVFKEIVSPEQYKVLHPDGFHAVNSALTRERIVNVFSKLYAISLMFYPLSILPAHVALFYIFLSSGLFTFIMVALFELSHHFVGVAKLDQVVQAHSLCWYRRQVESSSDYGGKLAGWLTGGLNFQVVHHIFPRVNSDHYPALQARLIPICEKHGINYTRFPSLIENIQSTCEYFKQSGIEKKIN